MDRLAKNASLHAVRVSRPSLLPPARAEFVVVADTHLMDGSVPHAAEFASRARQNGRVAAALRAVAGVGATTVVHVGDLVQDYPGSPLHEPLLAEAVEQWRGVAGAVHIAPGNTDVGDQHDPSSPAAPASPDSLGRFAKATGGCWSSFDVGPVRGIVLTASVFNSGLDLEVEQWAWLEAELAASAGRRLVVFFHYPVFLRGPDDPGTGNYDVVNEPARSRLLGLVERFGVEAVFTGHSHFAFYNRYGPARLVGAPSTSFTRPGFSEMFSSGPPPDRGRDDVPKLGFLVVRVHDDGIRVHPVRTGTLADADAGAGGVGVVPVVTAVSADVPGSPLGVVLRHPVAQFAEVPDTFPSVVRQPVRNDYPVLACLELGARHVSVSVADVLDPALAERLAVLRDDGVRVVARVLWPAGEAPDPLPSDAPVDDVELVLLGRAVPSDDDLDVLRSWPCDRAVTVSTLIRRPVPGAELPRWRYGLTRAEAVAADDALAAAGITGCRVLLAAAGPDEIAAVNALAVGHRWDAVDGIDVVVPIDGYGTDAASTITAAFLEAATRRGGRIFVDGLIELDRTLDLNPGLLDRACNPRPAFHALRTLNTLAHADSGTDIQRDGGTRYTIRRPGLHAVIDTRADADIAHADAPGSTGMIDLTTGTWLAGTPGGLVARILQCSTMHSA